MLESKNATVGDYEYKVVQLGAKQGRAVLVRIAKLLAPLGDGAEAEASLQKVLAGLSEDDLAFVCDAFAARTSYCRTGENKWPELGPVFDIHFAGRYGAMLKWLGFCVEVNFGSFLGELGVALPAVAKAA